MKIKEYIITALAVLFITIVLFGTVLTIGQDRLNLTLQTAGIDAQTAYQQQTDIRTALQPHLPTIAQQFIIVSILLYIVTCISAFIFSFIVKRIHNYPSYPTMQAIFAICAITVFFVIITRSILVLLNLTLLGIMRTQPWIETMFFVIQDIVFIISIVLFFSLLRYTFTHTFLFKRFMAFSVIITILFVLANTILPLLPLTLTLGIIITVLIITTISIEVTKP